MPHDDVTPGSPSARSGHLDEDTIVLASLGHALPEPDQTHLDGCDRCREEVAALGRIVTTARSEPVVEPVAVPAGTWAAIAGELRFEDRSAPSVRASREPAAASGEVVALRPTGRTVRRRSRWLPVAAALLVGLGLGVGGTRWLDGGPSPSETAPTTPGRLAIASAALEPLDTAVDPAGHGEAEVVEADGVRRLHLVVDGVSPAADGVLEVWLLNSDGGLVSLGIMSLSEMTVALPTDLDLDRFDVVDVSREPLDGNPGHSSDSVLRGVLTTGT